MKCATGEIQMYRSAQKSSLVHYLLHECWGFINLHRFYRVCDRLCEADVRHEKKIPKKMALPDCGHDLRSEGGFLG